MKKNLLLSLLLLPLLLTPVLAVDSIDYQGLFDSMQANNIDLKKAYLDYQKSTLDTKDAKGAYGPTIDSTTTFTYLANPPIGKIVKSADELMSDLNYPAGLPKPTGYVTIYDGMPNTYYNTSLTLTQPIFTWGKIGNAVNIFKTVEQIQSTKITDLENQFEAELKTRLTAYYYLNAIKSNLAEQQELANKLIKITTDAKQNGLMLEQDVLEVKMQASQIDLGLAEADNNLTSVLAGLEKLTGVSNLANYNITFTPDEDEIATIASNSTELIIEKATSNAQPSLQMLTKLNEVAALKTKVAKNSIYYKPDLALQLSANYGGSRMIGEKGWYQNSDWGFNVTVALKTTIWDGGKKMHDITRGKYDEQSSQADYQDAINTITQTVRETKANLDLLDAKIEYNDLKKQTDSLKLELQNKQRELGSLGEEEIIKTQLSIKSSEIEILKAKLKKGQDAYLLRYLSGL